MLVWGDQQEIDWFVAILEGEGWFSKNGDSPRIVIANNDTCIIRACQEFLKKNRVLYVTYSGKVGTKIGYRINITGQDCINLYNKIQHRVECRLHEFQQAVSSSETKCDLTVSLHWLIGIWEAEGNFCISVRSTDKITPVIQLSNTNNFIISKIAHTLHDLGLSWYIVNRVPEKKKPFSLITITGVKRCKRFLDVTNGLWKSQRNIQRSSLMLRYCLNRLSKPEKSKFTLEDFQMANQMRQFNSQSYSPL